MRVLLAGHISIDIRGGQKLLGGPPLYQIPIFEAFGFEIDVLTSFNQQQLKIEDTFPNVNFLVLVSDQTTTYHFKQIDNLSGDDRQLNLKSRARSIEIVDLENLVKDYDIVIVSPIAGEISLEVSIELASKGKTSFYDLQGIARHFTDEGLVYAKLDKNDLLSILREFDVIKGSKSELGEFCDFINPYKSHLIITDNGNNIIRSRLSKIIEFQIDKNLEILDATGSGDIFLSVIAGLFDTKLIDDCIDRAHKIAKASLNILGVPNTEIIYSQFKLFKIKK